MSELKFYKVAVVVDTENDKGESKKIKEEYYVHAISLSDVETKVAEYMKNSMFEFSTTGAVETKVLDIIGYQKPE